MPVREDWKRLAEHGFQDFRLKVGGLVENPVELSLADIEQLGTVEHITMHHCIQGWSGIAKWGGIPMKTLIALVRPKAGSQGCRLLLLWRSSVRRCTYYDTQSMENLLKAECLLAFRMNGQPLPAGVWRATEAARGESTGLQDGQVDRAY